MNGNSFEYWTQLRTLARLRVVNDCYLLVLRSNSLILNKQHRIVSVCYAVLEMPLMTG